jgi:hypothetical protein
MEEEKLKCKACESDLDKEKGEWYYCSKCWKDLKSAPCAWEPPANQPKGTPSTDGLLSLIDSLKALPKSQGGDGGKQDDLMSLLDPSWLGDKHWFESPLVAAKVQGKKPKGFSQWAKMLWNIDFFIEKWPVGKTLIAIIVMLSFLF